MNAPFGNPLDEKPHRKTNATQEIEHTLIGSLLARPELWPEVEFLGRGDFNDSKLGDAFEAARVLIAHNHAVNNLTVAARAAGDVPPERMDAYEREMGGYLLMVQQDRGYRTCLTPEAKLLRKHRLNRERKAAAAKEDWATVKRVGDDIAALDKPAVQLSMTAKELWEKEFPPLRWLVEGVLPEGATLLVSPPKTGKTRLATQLAIAMAAGGYALNNPDTRAEKVGSLYLALESGDRRAQKDMKQLIDKPPDGLHFNCSWRRLSEGGTGDLEKWLDHHPDVKHVTVDTLAKVRDKGHGGKGFLYSLDYDVGAAIKSITDARGVSFVLNHHSNKLGDATPDILDTVSGSTGVTGSVDHILILKRSRLQADGLLTLISRDFEDRAWAMRFESGLWRLVGTPEQAAEEADWRGDGESEARQAILSLLRKEGAMEPKDIVDGTGNRNARKLLMKLSESGKVVRRMDGKYVAGSGNSSNNSNSGNSGNSGNSHIENVAVAGSSGGNRGGNSQNCNQGIDNAKESCNSTVAVATVATVATVLWEPRAGAKPKPSGSLPDRILATLRVAGGNGMDEDDLVRVACNGEKGATPALVKPVIGQMLLAGDITRINGRLVATRWRQ